MRSTNTQRLSVCVSAASGQQGAATLATLNRRVAQVFAGRTKADRQSSRATARIRADVDEGRARMEALQQAIGSRLDAMRSERTIWASISPPNAAGPSAADS